MRFIDRISLYVDKDFASIQEILAASKQALDVWVTALSDVLYEKNEVEEVGGRDNVGN